MPQPRRRYGRPDPYVTVTKGPRTGTRFSRIRGRKRERKVDDTTFVYVGWDINLGGIDYVVRSSNSGGPQALEASDWPSASYEHFVRRMRSGADKGRVLSLSRVNPFNRVEDPVALLPYHLESRRELLVKAPGCANVASGQRDFIAILLVAADAVLRQGGGGGRILWEVPPGNDQVRREARDHGFNEAPGGRVRGMRVMERRCAPRP